MSDPIRLRILKTLCELIATEVSTQKGCVNDLTDAVFRGRDRFVDDDPCPMVSILEAPKQDVGATPPGDSAHYLGPWDLFIQGFVRDDRDNPTDPAHVLMAEVKRALAKAHDEYNQWYMLKNDINGISIGPGVVRPADEISGSAYFWLNIRLTLVENMSDPFAA